MTDRKIALSVAYCLGTGISLFLAFLMPPGPGQLAMLGLAMFLVAGTTGPAGAMVANLTPLTLHGSAFATLTLANNNLIGLAPGPILTGQLADQLGLLGAFRLLPLTCIAAGIVFAAMHRSYLADLNLATPAKDIPCAA